MDIWLGVLLIISAILLIIFEVIAFFSWRDLKNKYKLRNVMYAIHLSPFIMASVLYVLHRLYPFTTEWLVGFLIKTPFIGSLIALVYIMPLYVLAKESQREMKKEVKN